MRKCPRRRLLLVAALVVTANVLDLLSTYAVSPSLAGEWNILERQFGLGWIGLVYAKLLGVWLAVAGYAYYLRYREECYPPPGADPVAFRRHLCLGRPGGSLLHADTRRHLGVNLGYFWTGMQALVVWVALDNFLLRAGILFPLRHVTEMGYHLFQSAIIGSVVLARFYAVNYRDYRRMTRADWLDRLPETRPAPAAPRAG